MSVYDKYGNFSFSGITFYDKESFDKVMDEFKKYFGRYVSSIDGKRRKGTGRFGFRTAEEKDDLRWMDIKMESFKNGTATFHGYGHRREIFRMIDFMKYYFKTRDIVCYKGWDNARRASDDMMYGSVPVYGYSPAGYFISTEEAEDEKLMRQRFSDWKEGKLPLPEGREKKQDEKLQQGDSQGQSQEQDEEQR